MFIRSVRSRAALLAVTSSLAALPGAAHAGAFYLADQSTKATGRAYSGEAAERGAQQQWFNPAAIGGITGIENYFGLTALLPYGKARNIGSTVTRPALLGSKTTPVGGAQVGKNPVNKGYLPNGGFAIPLGDKFAFGFTTASPFSLTTNYDKDFWGRYAADKTRLRTFDFQPSIAFSPSSHVSFGASPNVEYVRATLSNYLPDPLSATSPDGHQYLKGHSWDVGYSLGFQYHDEKVDIGASYKSAIKHHVKGHLIIDGIDPSVDPLAALVNQRVDGAKANFETPWQVSASVRYHATPQLTVEGQITRFGWERFDAVRTDKLNASIGAQTIVENYKNSFSYSVGFDYDVSRRLTVRGGVVRDLSPVQDGYRDPRIPDGNRWAFAGGLTLALNDFMAIDAAATYAKIASNPIDKVVGLYDATLLAGGSANNDGVLTGGHALLFSLGGHVAF